MSITGRYTRQSALVSQDNLGKNTPIIVGCGAVGSQVAQMLAQMGSNLILIDPDEVGNENLSCQGFRESDLGKPKVEALKERLLEFNSEIDIQTDKRRFNIDKIEDSQVIFCCVDTMESRKFIFEKVDEVFRFFVDGRTRAGAEIRVLVAERGVKKDDPSVVHYPTTLFSDAQAADGACSAKTTIYGAMCTACIMVSHYTRWLKGESAICSDTMFDLYAMDSDFMV